MAENGLYDVLRMGISSLRAQSRAIETVGRNMANVNNPTYSRQRVIFGDVSPTGGASVGVDIIEVQQVRDVLLAAREEVVDADHLVEWFDRVARSGEGKQLKPMCVESAIAGGPHALTHTRATHNSTAQQLT